MVITPVLCISEAPLINETMRWKGEGRGFLLRYRKWFQSIWGETRCSAENLLLHPRLKWQLIFLLCSGKNIHSSPAPLSGSNDKDMFALRDCKCTYIIHIYIICEHAFALTWSFWQTLKLLWALSWQANTVSPSWTGNSPHRSASPDISEGSLYSLCSPCIIVMRWKNQQNGRPHFYSALKDTQNFYV